MTNKFVWHASLFIFKLAVCCKPVGLIYKPGQELMHYDVALCKEDFSVYKLLLQFHNSINRSFNPTESPDDVTCPIG